ncbi:MAG TPA: hydrogenase maturation nickel metallochaperone HypA, partial [Calditrichae bacterium]|nr:hydrogenase maturation nickel metallochaperone HypA [Calditrichia bacterium]
MHEFSIVQNLLQLIETQAREHQASRVTRVVVKVGKFSGVEPHLLQTAF